MNATQTTEKQTAVDAVKELLDLHFDDAEDCADEDGKFSLGCRVSKVTTDEIECCIDDPNQPKLPL